LIARKFLVSVVSLLMAVGAKNDEVPGIVRPTLRLLHNVMNFKAFLGADGAPMPGLNKELIPHLLRDCH
jgi:hypothetical protein